MAQPAQSTGTHRDADGVLSTRPALSPLSLPRGRAMPPEQWAAHHAFVLRTLTVLVVAVPGYAVLRGHGPGTAALSTALLALLILAARTTLLRRSTRAATAALGLMTAAALGVYLSGGQTEAHFLFFALLPLAALYAARAPFLLAVGFVAAHHFLLGTLLPHGVFEHDVAPLPMASLHAAFVLLESWACLAAWRRFDDRRERVEQLVAERTRELSDQRDELARLAAVVQSTDDAVATVTPDGRITSWNPGAERLYGWPADDVIGRHVSLLTAGEETPADLTALAGCDTSVERRHRRRAAGGAGGCSPGTPGTAAPRPAG